MEPRSLPLSEVCLSPVFGVTLRVLGGVFRESLLWDLGLTSSRFLPESMGAGLFSGGADCETRRDTGGDSERWPWLGVWFALCPFEE